MIDRGYTDRPVRQLSDAELLEEALQVRHSAGYYAGVLERGGAPDEYEPLLIEARDRRNACFAELRRRLENAKALAKACEDGAKFVAKYAVDTESVIACRALDRMETALAQLQEATE